MLHKPLRAPIGFQPMPARSSGQPSWYREWDSNPHYRRSERRASSRLGYPGETGARGAIRTLTGQALDLLPLPIGIRAHWCEQKDSNLHLTGFKPAASGYWAMLASRQRVLTPYLRVESAVSRPLDDGA
jgi:hypothetical protein